VSSFLSAQPLLPVFMMELFFTAGSLLQMKLVVILFYFGSPPSSDPACSSPTICVMNNGRERR
jgi:hypothetical protein